MRYRFAKVIDGCVKRFVEVFPKNVTPAFNCNGILNYVYSEPEGKEKKGMHGPIRFGEIACQPVNQTPVSLEIQK